MNYCEATLEQVLNARERRAARQQKLLEHGLPLLCFTLNLPGPKKRGGLEDFAFLEGERLIAAQGLEICCSERMDQPAGLELLCAVRMPPEELKAAAMAIEGSMPLGRLFDMDVICPMGGKLARPEPRRCLVCGGPAAPCARSRAHGLGAVQTAVQAILRRHAAGRLAYTAQAALLEEVRLTPKPGLVDAANNGAHADMCLATFERSAHALLPFFEEMAAAGLEHAGYDCTMAKLREAGLRAEAAMLDATGGVNTHRGLIYSLGLALGGMGMALAGAGGSCIEHAARLAAVGLGEALKLACAQPKSHGERAYAQHGAAGARGEAAAGFPAALGALSALREGRAQLSEREARLFALLSSMSTLEDTNLLHRGGRAGLAFVQAEARRILELPPSQRICQMQALDTACIEKNLSPGGSADVLALALFLDMAGELSPVLSAAPPAAKTAAPRQP